MGRKKRQGLPVRLYTVTINKEFTKAVHAVSPLIAGRIVGRLWYAEKLDGNLVHVKVVDDNGVDTYHSILFY